MLHTRANIAFAVSYISQHMHSPKKRHLEAVYKIPRYLQDFSRKWLFFNKSERKEVEVFTDSKWAGLIEDKRPTLGYCTYVWGNLATWRSMKQSVMARSSVEIEFRAIAQRICKGPWLRKLLEELHVVIKFSIKLYCDQYFPQSCSAWSHQAYKSRQTLHKRRIEEGTIWMTNVPKHEQTIDIFTKWLPWQWFDDFIYKLDMITIYNPTWVGVLKSWN